MLKLGRWTVLSLVLGLLFGCKSAEKTDYYGDIVSDLNTLQTELKDGIFQIDSVTKSLNKLAASQGDLRQPLSDFQNSVAELDSTNARIRGLGDDLKAKEAAFQASWSEEIKTIESANVRRTAEQGRSDVASAFRTLDQESDALGTKYREWESTVKSIQSSLEADLSEANLRSLSGKIKEANDGTARLKEGIRTFSSKLETLSATMKSSAT